MKKNLLSLFIIPVLFSAQKQTLTSELVLKLSEMPLKCINQEYPNKTAHIINSASEAILTPKDLHPSFYGCFDWHSSVHGHWALVKILKENPNIKNAAQLTSIFEQSFSKEALLKEAQYFTRYNLASNFERTYGWAWLLKLDEELLTWKHPKAKVWRENLKPLIGEVVKLWVTYLPKNTYPNRTGVHPNSAFALAFAIDWARATKNKTFELNLTDKARTFYLKDENAPAYLEPDGSDFFSPSLSIADLMRRILPKDEFVVWFDKFYEKKSIDNISQLPIISDFNDYQIVHLVGLSFSKAWNMKGIAKVLPKNHSMKIHFEKTSEMFLEKGIPWMFKSNYGGDHWLASFALYALKNQD